MKRKRIDDEFEDDKRKFIYDCDFKLLKRKRIEDYEEDCNDSLKKKQKYYCIYEEYKKYKRYITMYI
jgi:hypothetical protein